MNKHILIIDDEQDVATYLMEILESSGYVPHVAYSVEEGVRELAKFVPDLICMDIMMPKESGISFYTKIREDDKLQSIPVIIISGLVQKEDFDFRSFVSDQSIPEPEQYFEKPIDVDEFLKTVEKLTGMTESADHGQGGAR